MLLLLVSVLLSLAALAGMALTVLQGSLMTVDGLFFTLILATIFAILALNSLSELRNLRAKRATSRVAHHDAAPRTEAAAPGTASARSSEAARSVPPSGAVSAVAAVPPLPRRIQPRQPGREQQVTIDGITAGTVLVKAGVPAAEIAGAGGNGSVTPESGQTPQNISRCTWKAVDGTRASLERSLREAGLDIFYLVGALQGSGWAWTETRALRKALRPVLAGVEAQGRNAVEIATLSSANLLGLHHVTVVAHARHIQRTPVVLESPGTALPRRAPQEITRSTAAPAKAA